jgi:hypothetical protein
MPASATTPPAVPPTIAPTFVFLGMGWFIDLLAVGVAVDVIDANLVAVRVFGTFVPTQ